MHPTKQHSSCQISPRFLILASSAGTPSLMTASEYHGRASRDKPRVWIGWSSKVIHWCWTTGPGYASDRRPRYVQDYGPRYAPDYGLRLAPDRGPCYAPAHALSHRAAVIELEAERYSLDSLGAFTDER